MLARHGSLIEQQTMPTRGKSDRRCYTTSWDTIVPSNRFSFMLEVSAGLRVVDILPGLKAGDSYAATHG